MHTRDGKSWIGNYTYHEKSVSLAGIFHDKRTPKVEDLKVVRDDVYVAITGKAISEQVKYTDML